MIIIISGVSGVGKTRVGRLLAENLGWVFYDADDFHPAANIKNLNAGVALTDADRRPWLENLRKFIEHSLAKEENVVLACSALKQKYRECLRVNSDVKLVLLRGTFDLIAGRLRKRRGHFMNPALLKSQFADLEEPKESENALVIEASRGPHRIVAEIIAGLDLVTR